MFTILLRSYCSSIKRLNLFKQTVPTELHRKPCDLADQTSSKTAL